MFFKAFIKPSTRIVLDTNLKATAFIGLNRYRLSFTASFILIGLTVTSGVRVNPVYIPVNVNIVPTYIIH